MKKFKLFALALTIVMAGMLNVNAETIEVDTTDEFLSAIKTSGDIKLTDNIDFGEFTGKKVTIAVGTEINLNLNGYTISGKATNEKIASYLIQNNGTLIIEDTSIIGTGKITLSDNNTRLNAFAYGIHTINNEGTLVVNSGTIENTGGTDVPYAIDNNTTNRNAIVTINGGKIIGARAAMRAFCNSTKNENKITINGGTIIGGNSAVWISQVSKRANKGYLEINGGTIYGQKNNGIYVSVFDQSLISNMKVKITGGTIKNNSETSATFMYEPWTSDSDLANAVIDLDITGGTFINENTKGIAFHQYSQIPVTYTNITGGIFSSDVTEYIVDGYVSKLVNGNYVVGIEKNVNITSNTSGTITTDKQKSIVGEIVTITITPNANYELVSVKVVDSENNVVNVADNQFVMPNSEVTITVEFSEVKHTTEITPVDPTEEVEEVEVGVKDAEETEEVLLESLTETLKGNETLSEVLTNTSATVEVEIAKVEESTIEELVVDSIKEKVGTATLATFFDITVAIKNAKDNTIIDTIDELTKEIELMILLPEELKNANKAVNRTYYVVREHDGVVEALKATLSEDGNYLVFKSNKFSTYALAYEDKPIESPSNPQTLDNITSYIALGSLSVLVLSGIVLGIKRKKLFN